MEARGGRHHNGHSGNGSGHNRHANGGGFGHNSKRAHRGGGGGGGGGGGRGHHGHGGGFSHGHGGGGRGSFWFKGEGYNDFEALSIEEDVVGIRGFLSPDHPGFKGLVKQRYSDFVVHEIGTNMQPVELTALVAKKRTIQASFTDLVTAFAFGESANETPASTPLVPPTSDHLKLIRQLAKSVGHSAAAQGRRGQEALENYNHRRLVQLVTRELGAKMGGEFAAFLDKVKTRKQAQAQARAAGISAETTGESTSDLQFFVAGLHEKGDRVFIHETMRRFGKTLIVADTITSPDQSQVIRIRPVVGGPPKKGERDPRRDWPVDKPDYLQFVVYKRNKEIMAVVNQIAAVVKVNPSLFSFAEAKDKRGITTQLCTAYRVAKERFQAFVRLSSGRNLDEQNYLVGNLKYVPKKLSLGDCGGNAFSIVVRGIPDEHELSARALQEAVEAWRARGFINFFGIQRFGSSATPHHILGRAMLRKDFKLAVLLLLRPQDGEASKIRQAREHFRQHKDVAAALRMLPPFLIPERAVLEGLLQHGLEANELAFRSIPVHLRLAYVESYQNYVWNQMASLRIEQLSRTSAVVGDLVFAPGDVDADVDAESSHASRRRVLTLTTENVGDYTIHDVVLPLPGFQVAYPANEIGAAYQKLLAMDGVDFAAWASATQSANHHPYDVKGSYRHVVKTPQDVRYDAQTYTDSNQPLLLNDVDKLLGRTTPLNLQRPSGVTDAAGVNGADRGEPEKDKDKKLTPGRALVLHFRLDYGSDATIAVRELLKQSSSMHMSFQKPSETKDGATLVDKPHAKAGDSLTGKKRPSTTTLAGNKSKDVKVTATQKKTQVSIGRPGFSLGKGH